LYDLVPATGAPTRLGEDGVAETDESADHANPLRMQATYGRAEVVNLVDSADPAAERDVGVEPDHAGLILQVKLDRVDPPVPDQPHDPGAERRIRPRVERHVDGPDGDGRSSRDQQD
jgi:hypothetical protein